MTAVPPVYPGGAKVTVACPVPAETEMSVGAPGSAATPLAAVMLMVRLPEPLAAGFNAPSVTWYEPTLPRRVPEMMPVTGSMLSPSGRPLALKSVRAPVNVVV